MAIIFLKFSPLNVSAQPTDIVYACAPESGISGVNPVSIGIPGDTKPVAIGEVIGVPGMTGIGLDTIAVDDTDYPAITLSGCHYFFFSKDRRVGMSGILGYYALVEYRNYSKKQAEIFATSTEFSPSSK